MFFFVPQPDQPETSTDTNRAALALGIGVAVFMGLLVMLLARGGSAGMFIVATAVIMIGVAFSLYIIVNRQSASAEEQLKRKRGEAGDMYTLIDRLVAELDDDERAYLLSRLDATEPDEQVDLADMAADLLDQREEDRRQGLR